MNHFQLPIPEYRLKGFSLIKHAIALQFKHALPILLLVAIISIPIQGLKNYYFFVPDQLSTNMDTFVDLIFLSAIAPMVIYYILGRLNASQEGIKPSILWGLSKWPRMIGYNFLIGIILVAGILLFVVPGIVIGVWLMLVPVIVSIMDTSKINPLSFSRKLARKRFFKIVGYTLAGITVMIIFVAIEVTFIYFFVSQSWITATLFDLLFDWISQFFIIVLLLVFLQVKTEIDDQEAIAIEQPI